MPVTHPLFGWSLAPSPIPYRCGVCSLPVTHPPWFWVARVLLTGLKKCCGGTPRRVSSVQGTPPYPPMIHADPMVARGMTRPTFVDTAHYPDPRGRLDTHPCTVSDQWFQAVMPYDRERELHPDAVSVSPLPPSPPPAPNPYPQPQPPGRSGGWAATRGAVRAQR